MLKVPQVDQEFKELMPPLTEEEYNQLEQNILAKRKCYDPIVLWDSLIVDGFNRYCICATHGIEFNVKDVTFASREDAKVWIIENQLGRRNLNAAQRIELVLCKEEVLREKAKENQSRAGRDNYRAGKLSAEKTNAVDVYKDMAQEAGVSEGTLKSYRRIKQASPALLEKVQSGELKIDKAHRMLFPEIKKQLEQAGKWLRYIKNRLPLKNEEDNRNINCRLNQLTKQIGRLVECCN